MSREKELENIFSGLRLLMTACIGGLFACLGYGVMHYKEIDLFQMCCVIAGCLALLTIIGASLKLYLKKLKEMRDL